MSIFVGHNWISSPDEERPRNSKVLDEHSRQNKAYQHGRRVMENQAQQTLDGDEDPAYIEAFIGTACFTDPRREGFTTTRTNQSAKQPARWNAPSSDYVPVPLPLTSRYMADMKRLVHDEDELEAHRYILNGLSQAELLRKIQRCGRCFKSLPKSVEPKASEAEHSADTAQLQYDKTGAMSLVTQLDALSLKDHLVDKSKIITATLHCPPDEEEIITGVSASTISRQAGVQHQAKVPICNFHRGCVVEEYSQRWSCCGRDLYSPPCTTSVAHQPIMTSPRALERDWTFYLTPQYGFDTSYDYRFAVAIDCEMGISSTGESELIRVTVVDYESGEVLLDSLVWPRAHMQHYNTPVTGITEKHMDDALRSGAFLMYREAARQAVWKFVGPDTIVCLHSGQNDLAALRWIHFNIIDTFLLEPVPVVTNATTSSYMPADKEQKRKQPKGSGPRSLKTLARVKLGRDIQKRQHDSVEDAVATKDLVHWAIINGLSKRVMSG